MLAYHSDGTLARPSAAQRATLDRVGDVMAVRALLVLHEGEPIGDGARLEAREGDLVVECGAGARVVIDADGGLRKMAPSRRCGPGVLWSG